MADAAPGTALVLAGGGLVAAVLTLAMRRARLALLPVLLGWALWSAAALLSVVNTLE